MAALSSFFETFNSKIEEPVRLHLKNVYACLTMATLSAAVGAYVALYTSFLSNSLLVFIGAVGFLVGLYSTRDNGKNQLLRLGLFLGFSFFTGLGLSPLLDFVIQLDPTIIPTALMSTTVVFVSFSLSALFARRGSWLFLGGIISTLFSALFIFSLASLFFRSALLFKLHLYVGLFLMCLFVLYDTQHIIEKRRRGDRDFISHSIDLFIDFIGIFRRIVIILAEKESNKREKKRSS